MNWGTLGDWINEGIFVVLSARRRDRLWCMKDEKDIAIIYNRDGDNLM